MKKTILLLSCFFLYPANSQNNSTIPTQGMVAYYPFNGNAYDMSDNGFNGTVSGASLTSDRFGRANSAYSFNGIDSYIRLGDILDSVFCKPIAQFSVSGWAKTNVPGTTSAGGGFIIGKEEGGGLPGGHQWNIAHLDTRLFCWVNSDSASQTYVDKTNPINSDGWFHFVFIFDGSLAQQDRIKIYVNGTSNMGTYSQRGSLGTSTQNTSQELTIGAGHKRYNPSVPNNAYNGLIDDIRIYSKAIADSEVQALYHEGGWPLTPEPTLALYYPFSGNSNDSSGYGNNGVVAGATLTTDRFGVANRAYSFNGTNSTIRCGDILDSVFSAPVAKFSVSGWAMTRTYGSFSGGGGYIIGKNGGGDLGPYQWNVTHDNGLLYGAVFFDTLGHNYVALTSPMTKSQWFHFVLVFDGTQPEMQRVKLYVNGQSSNSTVYQHVGTLGTTTVNSQQELTIGATHPGGNPSSPTNCYDGNVDDIRIYSRVLSETEIQTMYHEGGWPGSTTIDVPRIISVKDVPNDNGKQVLISWQVARPAALNGISRFSIRYWDKANLVWVSEPGDIDAYPDTIHSIIVATLYDSTKSKGMYYSVFQVAAHGVSPEVVTISPPDSGYSVDNLSPLAPTNLGGRPGPGNTWIVSWKSPIDQVADFKDYVVYRSTTQNVSPDSSHRLGDVKDTVYVDSTIQIGTTYYYGITSIDSSGNESRLVTLNSDGMAVDQARGGIPTDFELSPNFPNPFNPSTTIKFGVPVPSHVKIEIFNILGQRISEFANVEVPAGYFQKEWQANCASGLYLCRIEAVSLSDPNKRFVAARKMLMVK